MSEGLFLFRVQAVTFFLWFLFLCKVKQPKLTGGRYGQNINKFLKNFANNLLVSFVCSNFVL